MDCPSCDGEMRKRVLHPDKEIFWRCPNCGYDLEEILIDDNHLIQLEIYHGVETRYRITLGLKMISLTKGAFERLRQVMKGT